MEVQQQDLGNALKQHFGFDQFKGNQEAIIRNVLDRQNTFVIMPTGGGKSLCYQLPALMMDGTAIVISPLIALMKNQVDSVRAYHSNDAVAHFLNSSLSKTESRKVKDDLMAGNTKLLYIAPETLTKEENIDFLRSIPISFVAVDEAHCISEWGHDFRPEYRRIREMVDMIRGGVPIVALTATATPKVQADIVKNLQLGDHKLFKASFNRSNLYYEIRPKGSKDQVIPQLVKLVKEHPDRSGIIYAQSRKSTEEIAQLLRVNGIKAAPYHAGLDAKTRAKVQDDFLMEEVDVICATIAFGMGIDKPDVRFVIHYDIPKSIENYYQETGRAGRDGREADCVAFFSYQDISKLEKFLRDKPVAEREMGGQLLDEVIAFTETSACRRKYLLHYFGEVFQEEDCHKMCDNCRHPKEKINVRDEMVQAVKMVEALGENYRIPALMDIIMGKQSKEILDFGLNESQYFGIGKEKDKAFWQSVIRNAVLNQYLKKDIEQYGVIKMGPNAQDLLNNAPAVEISINHDYEKELENAGDQATSKSAALDDLLLKQLRDLRKSFSKTHNVPPFVIFQDASLEDMATQYPISMDDMTMVSGVSKGKAQRYGRPFLELIKEYVEANDIDRPTDMVVKQVANKSKSKVAIISAVDRKVPFDDIAASNNMSMADLLQEMEMIVASGTKLNIDYYIDEEVDEYTKEDIYDYFMQAETDSVDEAFSELSEDDITMEEIQLVRIKFMSDMAN